MSDEDPYKCTGRTTRQILSAPRGATYLWPYPNTSYPRGIALDNGRDDIKFIYASDLGRLVGFSGQPVVVDHSYRDGVSHGVKPWLKNELARIEAAKGSST
jgi:hypothetical protein